MKVLVCGGRDYSDREVVYAHLDGLLAKVVEAGDRLTVIHGHARGADELADDWAREKIASYVRVSIHGFRADWTKHGRAAGPIRNQRMLDEGKPDLVVAFPGGKGTADMVRRAREAGVEVVEVGG